MADALISPIIGGSMLALSSGALAYSIRDVRKHFDESRIPLMGVAGAFIFAAQMVNFAIPGTGSSGHIAGAVLLSALLGPSPAFIVMAGVLLIQALFFADGGLLAWGCNLFNIGFFGCFLAYPYIFKPIAGKSPGRARLFAASTAASIAALELGAFGVTVETLLSGVTELPFRLFLSAMLSIHLAIAIGEGMATGAALTFIKRHMPEADALRLEEKKFSISRLFLILGVSALFIGGGVSLLASENPDGLEWSISKIAGTDELQTQGAGRVFFSGISQKLAIFPDYTLPDGGGPWGTAAAGTAGVLICVLLIGAAGCALHVKKTRRIRTK